MDSTRKVFEQYFPKHKIKVHPVPYVASLVDVVDIDWIQSRMNSTKTKLKDLAEITGIDKTTLSGIINGHKPLSQPVKAMFFFLLDNVDKYKG